jgi:hypothetical protein
MRYGKVFTGYWTSPDIADLSIEIKAVGAYLLTSSHSNMIGCYRLPIAYAVDDLKMGSVTLSKGFESLSGKGFIVYDSALSWVVVRKYLKWNPIENPNQGKAAAKLVSEIPRMSSVYGPLVEMLKANPANFPEGFIDGLETLPEGYRNQEPYPYPYPQQQPEQHSCAALVPSAALEVPAVILIPLNDGSDYGISQGDLDEWRELFPAVDVLQQLRNYKAWSLAKPRKRKTRRGIRASITSWLADKQDKGNSGRENNSHAASYVSPATQRQRTSDDNIQKAFQALGGDQNPHEPGSSQFLGAGTHGRDGDLLDGRMVATR